MKYQLKTPSIVDAFVVVEISSDFHGKSLALLDDGAVVPISTGAANQGDYMVIPEQLPAYFSPKAEFENIYAPLV